MKRRYAAFTLAGLLLAGMLLCGCSVDEEHITDEETMVHDAFTGKGVFDAVLESDIAVDLQRYEQYQSPVRQFCDGYSGLSAAVLYQDGTVRVVGLEPEKNEAVRQWADIDRIIFNGVDLFGLKKDGTAVSTGDHGALTQLRNVTDLCVLALTDVVYALTEDGTVHGFGPAANESVNGLSGVKKLISNEECGIFAILEDGSMVAFDYEQILRKWDPVADLRDALLGAGFVIRIFQDGTVYVDDAYEFDGTGSYGKIGDFHNTVSAVWDWMGAGGSYQLYSLSSEGTLQVYGGWERFEEEYGGLDGLRPLDTVRLEGIESIHGANISGSRLIMLYSDGHVGALDKVVHEQVSTWTDVQKVVTDMSCVYALRKDGGFYLLDLEEGIGKGVAYDDYEGFKLLDIYPTEWGVCMVALREDGSLVAVNARDGYYDPEVMDLKELRRDFPGA